MKFLQGVKKSFYRLTEDYSCESAFYPEEICFLPAGTEGVVIDCHTIGLIPNLSEEKYAEIVRRELRSSKDAAFLLLIAGRLIAIHVNQLEHVRSEGCNIFEDDEDRNSYFDEMHGEIMKRALEDKKNAST
jgi:hypothetical protein